MCVFSERNTWIESVVEWKDLTGEGKSTVELEYEDTEWT